MKKLLLLLLCTTLLVSSCSSKTDSSSNESTTNTSDALDIKYDKYGQMCFDGAEDQVSSDNLPAYLKYGDKYIKLKEALSYYTELEYTYTPYVILVFDRSNLTDKDIYFLSENNEDNLDPSVYITTDESAELDDCIDMSYIGGYYDEKEWRMYFRCNDEFREEPSFFYTDIVLYVNNPNTKDYETNSCSIFDYKLQCANDEEMDSEMRKELNKRLKKVVEFYGDLLKD